MAAACGPAPTPSGGASPGASASVAPSSGPSATPAITPGASPEACAPVAFTGRWWDDRVFYEVFVRSFADSDGDGIGDLRGLTERLDYLNDGDPATDDDLGITGIWLMPVAEAASYHGYDVTDYTAIERDYGTREDFLAFMDAAHDRGIKVIVDLVLNHTSSAHPWFVESQDPASPKADWYRWSDTDPGYGGPSGQRVWYPKAGRWYYAQFWSEMPDLDLENPEVTAALEDVARTWLTDYGVDGFRLDAVKHLVEEGQTQTNTASTLAWLAGFKAAVRDVNPYVLLVGEVFDLTLNSAKYVPDAVDLTFDFELASSLLIAADAAEAPSLANTQRDVLQRYAGGAYAAFLTNHDQTRAATTLGGDAGKLRVAASGLLTGPGLPFVYYGEELGMAGAKPDERIRTPLPWTSDGPAAGFTTGTPWEPLEPGFETANVAAQLADADSLLAHYRGLIAARNGSQALRHGRWQALRSSDRAVYAFLATRGTETVAVIVNTGDAVSRDPSLTLRGATTCPAAGATVRYADGFGSTPEIAPPPVAVDGTLTGWVPVPELPAYATLIVSLDR